MRGGWKSPRERLGFGKGVSGESTYAPIQAFRVGASAQALAERLSSRETKPDAVPTALSNASRTSLLRAYLHSGIRWRPRTRTGWLLRA